MWRGQVQSPDVQEDRLAEAQALARRRHRPQHGEVPEEDLQQQRDVAERLDIDQGQPGNQPVFGQAGDADDETQQRGEDDTQHRDQQGVEQGYPEYLAVAGGRGIGNQALDNVETGGGGQKTEAGGDAELAQVGLGVLEDVQPEGDGGDESEDLKHNRPDLRVVPERRFDRSKNRLGHGIPGNSVRACVRTPLSS